jgi:hypothetical protein
VSSFDFNMYEGLVRRDRDLKLEAELAIEPGGPVHDAARTQCLAAL